MIRKMTEEEARNFYEERCTLLDYKDIQEYIKDIIVCLVYCTWHYLEERARQQCEELMAWGEEYYEQKEPVGNAAADIGYCCG